MFYDKSSSLKTTLTDFRNSLTNLKPQNFLRADPEISTKSLELLEGIYNFTKDEETYAVPFQEMLTFDSPGSNRRKKKDRRTVRSKTEQPLNKLITESFDHDQIWEELQLQNNTMYETLVSCTSRIMARHNKMKANVKPPPPQHQSLENEVKSHVAEEYEDLDFEDGSEDDDEESIEFEGNTVPRKKLRLDDGNRDPQKYSKSEVDDKFFNLAQMTEFIERVEAKLEHGADGEISEEEIDLFDDIDEGSEVNEEVSDIYYNQYFDLPIESLETQDQARSELKRTTQENSYSEASNHESDQLKESDSSDEETAKPSNFEERKMRIEENIKQLEEAALEAKPWKYQGEVTAEKRPENSLLEEHLIYDSLVRQAPEITVETTQKLEDIIKQRIKDKAWDDVERKIKPVDGADEYKKKLVLSAEKSKMSLAEIYEQEFISKKKAEEFETEAEERPQEELIIERDMKSLFSKLDALSNFHFTPKPATAEIKIITNVPSIAMEEIIPVNVADSVLLAPSEIQEPTKGEIKGQAERTATDKKHERRIKKKKQKLKRVARETKEKLVGNIIVQPTKGKNSKLNSDEKPKRKNQIKFK